jgi:hypothetical protein
MIREQDKNKISKRITAGNKIIKDWDKGWSDKMDGIQKRFSEVCLKYDKDQESSILKDLTALENQIAKANKPKKPKGYL